MWRFIIAELLSTAKEMQKALEDEINPTFESIKRFHKQQDDLFRKFTQFQHDLIGLCEKQIADCDKVCDRRSYDCRIEQDI